VVLFGFAGSHPPIGVLHGQRDVQTHLFIHFVDPCRPFTSFLATSSLFAIQKSKHSNAPPIPHTHPSTGGLGACYLNPMLSFDTPRCPGAISFSVVPVQRKSGSTLSSGAKRSQLRTGKRTDDPLQAVVSHKKQNRTFVVVYEGIQAHVRWGPPREEQPVLCFPRVHTHGGGDVGQRN
jgi:hypothetical protein